MTYAEPNNMTGIWGVFEYANDVTGSSFGIGVLIALYFIVLLWLKNSGEEFTNCAIAAGFITAIPAVLLFLGGLISNYQLFIAILVFALPLLWSYWNKST